MEIGKLRAETGARNPPRAELVQASEARPPQADANLLAESDDIVLRELQRRLTQDAS
jgi:hypothetical protein